MDLDLGVLGVLLLVLPLIFLPSIVAPVGFEREGLGHSVCPCHCIWCIGLSSPRCYVEVKFEKLITLGCLGTLELVYLGCFSTLGGWCCQSSINVV